MTRCRKHTPETIDSLRGTFRCSTCGRIGWKSRGQRKFGRPARINWVGEAWMEMFGAQYAKLSAMPEPPSK